jgi:hypothetical protein
MKEFTPFKKISRLSRPVIITEKIDGTNGCICIDVAGDECPPQGAAAWADGFAMWVGSRTRWITPEIDNHGFARWVMEHAGELWGLGPGTHYGEWWGQGIQRGYGLKEKRFSLFNATRWGDDEIRPACCHVVPIILSGGVFDTRDVDTCLEMLRDQGSIAAPGFMRPEGVVIFHVAGNVMFKKTIEKDQEAKGIKS